MKRRSSALNFVIFTGLSILCVGLLAFLQYSLRPSQFIYSFGTSDAKPAPTAFPLDAEFVQILPGSPAKFGKTVSMKDLLANSPKGLLVNYWATWCPPCIEELPSLETYHRQTKDRKDSTLPKLILLSVDEGLTPLQQLLGSLDFKPSFEIYLDRGGLSAQKMGSSKFPETYYLSPEGAVLYKWIGPQQWLSPEVLEKLQLTAAGQSKP